MKCPNCAAVIDVSFIDAFGAARSVQCPACGFVLENGDQDVWSTGTELEAIRGWRVRLAKGQNVHFSTEASFAAWLKRTTVTPGDQISRNGGAWQELGGFLLAQRKQGQEEEVQMNHGYQVPPNTLDAPDPEDEFEEFDAAVETLDTMAQTELNRSYETEVSTDRPIFSTEFGHEKRTPPPLPGRATAALRSEASPRDERIASSPTSTDRETHLKVVDQELEVSAPNFKPAQVAPASPAKEHSQSLSGQEGMSKPQSALPAPSQPKTGRGGALGMLMVGMFVGFSGTHLMGPTVDSSATESVEKNDIKSSDPMHEQLVETSRAWQTYTALKRPNLAALTQRLKAGAEVNPLVRHQQEMLALSAYLLDTEASSDEDLEAAYDAFFKKARSKRILDAHQRIRNLQRPMSAGAEQTIEQRTGVARPDEKQPQKRIRKSASVPPASEVVVNRKVAKAPSPKAQRRPVVQPKIAQNGVPRADQSFKSLLQKGQRALENGKLTAATEALVAAAQIKPKAHQAQFLLGYVYLNRGELTKALARFKQARLLKPQDRETLLGLGSVYEKQGKRVEARQVYETYQRYFTTPNDRRKIEYKLEKLGR